MENMVFNQYAVTALVIFFTGLIGALCKRNVIAVFMCIELMLCAAMLLAVSFSSLYGNMDGAVFAFFVLAIAASEVAVGLALIMQLFKLKNTVDLDQYNSLGD